MENKIALIYDGNDYQVLVNDNIITTTEKIEDAYECFEKTINNNKFKATGNWETIVDSVKKLDLAGVEIFEAYNAIQYKTVKYFHKTGTLFYIGKGEMLPLMGGDRLLVFILERVAKKQLEDSESFVEICARANQEGIVYHIKEDSFSLYSAIFNYGNVTYNFRTQEIHKGTHIEKGSFDLFKQYILEVIQ